MKRAAKESVRPAAVATINLRGKCQDGNVDEAAATVYDLFMRYDDLVAVAGTECKANSDAVRELSRKINILAEAEESEWRVVALAPPHPSTAIKSQVITLIRSDRCKAKIVTEKCSGSRLLTTDLCIDGEGALRLVNVYGYSGAPKNETDTNIRRALLRSVRSALRERRCMAAGDWNVVPHSIDRMSGKLTKYDIHATALHRATTTMRDVMAPEETRAAEDLDENQFTFLGTNGSRSRIDRIYISHDTAKRVSAAAHETIRQGYDHGCVLVLLQGEKRAVDDSRITAQELPTTSPWSRCNAKGSRWAVKREDCNQPRDDMSQARAEWCRATCALLRRVGQSKAAPHRPKREHHATKCAELETVWQEWNRHARASIGSYKKQKRARPGARRRTSRRSATLRACGIRLASWSRAKHVSRANARHLKKALRRAGIGWSCSKWRKTAGLPPIERKVALKQITMKVRSELRTAIKKEQSRRDARAESIAGRRGRSVSSLLRSILGSEARPEFKGTAKECVEFYRKRFKSVAGATERLEAVGLVLGEDAAGRSTYKFNEDNEVNIAQPSGSRRKELGPLFAHIDEEFTREEFEAGLKNIAQFKMGGPDGWTAGALRALAPPLQDVLFELIVTIQREKALPYSLRAATLICLPKGAKGFSSTVHRPITLLSYALKLIERLYMARIKQVLLDNPQIIGISAQCGGVAGRSTTEAARIVLTLIEDAIARIDEGEDLPEGYEGLFIFSSDVSAAFDGLTAATKELALRRLGLPEGFLAFVKESQDNAPRRVRFADGTFSEEFVLKRGAAQGSILSPFIWIAFVAMWLDHAEVCGRSYTCKSGVQISGVGFVDDIISAAQNEANMKETVVEFAKFHGVHSSSISAPKSMLTALRKGTKTLPEPIELDLIDWSADEEDEVEHKGIIKYSPPDKQSKYVGHYFAYDKVCRRSLAIASKQVAELGRLVEFRALSPRSAAIVVNTVIETKVGFTLEVMVAPEAELKRWDDRLRRAIASTYHRNSRFTMARFVYHGAEGLDKKGLCNIQLEKILAGEQKSEMATSDPITNALRAHREAGPSAAKRRGSALNDVELIKYGDPYAASRMVRARAFIAPYGVTIHMNGSATAAVPLGRRSPASKGSCSWSKDERDFTIAHALREWMVASSKRENELLVSEFKETTEGRLCRESEVEEAAGVRPLKKSTVHAAVAGSIRELSRTGIFTWQHILDGDTMLSWKGANLRAQKRGFEKRNTPPPAWQLLAVAIGSRKDPNEMETEAEARRRVTTSKIGSELNDSQASNGIRAPAIACVEVTYRRLRIVLQQRMLLRFRAKVAFETSPRSIEDESRLTWKVAAREWKVAIADVEKERLRRKAALGMATISAMNAFPDIKALCNKTAAGPKAKDCDGSLTRQITRLCSNSPPLIVPPSEAVAIEECGYAEVQRRASSVGLETRYISKIILIERIKEMQKSSQLSSLLTDADLAVEAAKKSEASKAASKHCYSAVWSGENSVHMQSLLRHHESVRLGSDGSLTPARNGESAKGGWAVAVGEINSCPLTDQPIASQGALPMHFDLESSTTGELFGAAGIAFAAAEFHSALGDIDSSSALAWANKTNSTIKPEEVVRSPAAGCIEAIIVAKTRREKESKQPVAWGKVKAHVTGLRTDAEVTNEAADHGAKDGAEGRGAYPGAGRTTRVIGTVVIALLGLEEIAPPKAIVKSSRHYLADFEASNGNTERQAMLYNQMRLDNVDPDAKAALLGPQARESDRRSTLAGLWELGVSENHDRANPHCSICREQGIVVSGDMGHTVNCVGSVDLAKRFTWTYSEAVWRAIQRDQTMRAQAKAWAGRTASGNCDSAQDAEAGSWVKVCTCGVIDCPAEQECEFGFASTNALNRIATSLGGIGDTDGEAAILCAAELATRATVIGGGRLRIQSEAAIKDELWEAICSALGSQVELNTTAASRGEAGPNVAWSSKVQRQPQASNAEGWSNTIEIAGKNDEATALLLQSRASETMETKEPHRSAIVLIRRARRTDAKCHAAALEDWNEWLSVSDGADITRPVELHSASDTMPKSEETSISVFVCSNAAAAAQWPITSEKQARIREAMDLLGVHREQYELYYPSTTLNQWEPAPRQGKEVQASWAFKELNSVFDQPALDRILSEAAPVVQDGTRTKARDRGPCSTTELKARITRQRRKGVERHRTCTEGGSDFLDWQRERSNPWKPCEHCEDVPQRMRSLGFPAAGQFGSETDGYALCAKNKARLVRALAKITAAFVRKARYRRSRLLAAVRLKTSGSSETPTTCIKCRKPLTRTECSWCKRKEVARRRLLADIKVLETPQTTTRANALAGRPIGPRETATNITGLPAEASSTRLRAARAAINTLRLALRFNGSVSNAPEIERYFPTLDEEAHERQRAPGTRTARFLAPEIRVAESEGRAEFDSMARCRKSEFGRFGRPVVNRIGARNTLVLDQCSPLRSMAPKYMTKLNRKALSIFRKDQADVLKQMARQQGPKLKATTAMLNKLLQTSEAHWSEFSACELREVCANRGLGGGGSAAMRKKLALRSSYQDYLDQRAVMSSNDDLHSRVKIPLPPIEASAMARQWTARGVALPSAPRGRGRKQKFPRSLTKHAEVREPCWNTTATGLAMADNATEEEVTRRTQRARSRSGHRLANSESGGAGLTEDRTRRVRETAVNALRGKTIEIGDEEMNIITSRDGSEIVAIGMNGLQEVTLRQVVETLADRSAAWNAVRVILDYDEGYDQITLRDSLHKGPPRIEPIPPQIAEEITRGCELQSPRESGAAFRELRVRQGDIVLFPAGYFGDDSTVTLGIALTGRVSSTNEDNNDMGKIYCDIATATDTEIWELDADITGKFGSASAVGAGSASNPWKIAIVGSLRADVIPK